MSDLIVEATKIREIQEHPNADALELAIVKGWQVVVLKDQFKAGDSVVHVPPDSMLQQELAQKLGVWKYLAVKKDAIEGRVKAVSLRQEMSYGFVFPNTDGYPEGEDLKETLGITKWEPPPSCGEGDADREHALFHKYTNIQNIKNFPDRFQEGEEVCVTEKIHGRSSRIGLVRLDQFADKQHEFMVGSHNFRRKIGSGSVYETGLTSEVAALLQTYVEEHKDVVSIIVFGEIFGVKMQDLQYGQKAVSFRAFDIAVNGKYLDVDDFRGLCQRAGVATVPVLHRGPYSEAAIEGCTKGKTTLMSEKAHVREGVVIKPAKERTDPKLGRLIIKSINDDYLLRKGGTEFH